MPQPLIKDRMVDLKNAVDHYAQLNQWTLANLRELVDILAAVVRDVYDNHLEEWQNHPH